MKRHVWMIGTALLAACAGYWAGRGPALPATAGGSSASSSASRSVLYWYDPMVPEQHFDKPGLSPMGMQMIPRYALAPDTAAHVVVDVATVQRLGVRVAPVQRRVLASRWQAPGTVTWDLRQASTVSARTDAVITRLHVRAPYAPVVKGSPLADILAPAWSSALAEAEALRQAQSPDAKALQEAAQERLAVLGLAPEDIRGPRAADGSLTLHAPRSGIVTSLEVREGQRVSAGQPLMTINDLSHVWVEAAIPQDLPAGIAPGMRAIIRSDTLPGVPIAGTVEALLPDLDPVTRTLRARVALSNLRGRLIPGQFVQVELSARGGTQVLVVPTDALINTGEQTRVLVAVGDGHFRPLAVIAGRSTQGLTEIIAGLTGDEQVVVSAQFLIDSEASLSGALDRLSAPPGSSGGASATPVEDTR
jgi:Cu(I)/Ag(I) efflux system membrane fusion protein